MADNAYDLASKSHSLEEKAVVESSSGRLTVL